MAPLENLQEYMSALPPEREEIIKRIMNLSDEQFERLITLYSQQEKESDRADPNLHRTSA